MRRNPTRRRSPALAARERVAGRIRPQAATARLAEEAVVAAEEDSAVSKSRQKPQQ